MELSSIKNGGTLTRPPSVHSLRSALKALDLPSMPPTVPLPPIPTSPSSTKSRSATIIGSPRPTMGSTKKASLTSISWRPHKPIKYGSGKFSHVELVPQPSDDPQDPLNWQQWKKELNLVSLLFMASLIGAMKTALIAVNQVVAVRYNVSYTWVVALTAVPLMVSACTGFLSSMAAKLVGKRPVYLASSAFIFAGCLWNMTADASYGSCMGARVMQGLGWGAFDTLLMETIQDTFYEHERNIRVTLYNILTITTTWASPLIGGVVSYQVGSFVAQYRIISALFAVAIPLLALTAPETAFDRSKAAIATTPVFSFTFPWEPRQAHRELNRDSVMDYVKEMRPWSYSGEKSISTWIQAPRALAAPTTTLVFIVTALPHCALWGLVASLSLLLSPSPINLQPSIIGTLLTGPWVLAILLVAGICFYRSAHQKFTRCVSSLTVAGGALLALIGLLSFGLDVSSFMARSNKNRMAFFTPESAQELNLPVLSLQLGLLAAGAYTLEATARPLLARSASFTASSMAAAQRSIGDMHSWVVILRNLLAGAFVLAVPHVISKAGGLKAIMIALGTAQVAITVSVLLLWRLCEKAVWRVDGKAMGLVNLRMPHPEESFFDTD
ncbi:major facilitator superfamily transporter [Trichoderma arundinaceum]|uniref:Major facilitator superfamily transporter n=1 Tax=Trichoderma arundinaceum TaxID=490622 RepID=A0A395NG32_TRIAR|nr:major facilitator superfamily transporter [Trichoderma arundinaceum]